MMECCVFISFYLSSFLSFFLPLRTENVDSDLFPILIYLICIMVEFRIMAFHEIFYFLCFEFAKCSVSNTFLIPLIDAPLIFHKEGVNNLSFSCLASVQQLLWLFCNPSLSLITVKL